MKKENASKQLINGCLVGHAAIEYAEENDLLLNKFADPTEDARKGLTVNEAREIAFLKGYRAGARTTD